MENKTLEEKIDLIMSNHLPHLQMRLDDLDSKMKLVLFVLGAVFVAALAQYFKA